MPAPKGGADDVLPANADVESSEGEEDAITVLMDDHIPPGVDDPTTAPMPRDHPPMEAVLVESSTAPLPPAPAAPPDPEPPAPPAPAELPTAPRTRQPVITDLPPPDEGRLSPFSAFMLGMFLTLLFLASMVTTVLMAMAF